VWFGIAGSHALLALNPLTLLSGQHAMEALLRRNAQLAADLHNS
jgi:hypothetical protein